MRGNAWQITAIIAIILVVILIVPLVIMGRNHQTLVDQAKQASDNQRDAASKAAQAESEAEQLKELFGGSRATTLDKIKEQHTEIMAKTLPGEDNATQTYHNALTVKLSELAKEKEEHRKTSEDLAQLQSDFEAKKDEHKADLAKVDANLQKAENNLREAAMQFQAAKEDYRAKFEDAHNVQKTSLSKSEREKAELSERLQQVEVASRDIRDTNINLAAMLEDVRNPNVEYPAGKIISVNQQAGLAIINLGYADGLLVRTMFSVYHSSITGITFRTAPVGRDPIYCDVCKREVSRDVSKASVEVMQILGPHQAEVRILDDILTDPIMKGDVVYSPIWKPGQKLRFALAAGMNLPGAVAGTEAVRRLIESYGGVVDCWIDDVVDEGEDYLKGSISDLTNFVVVNETAARDLNPEVARIQEELLESARNRAIKKISLGDLLNRTGWKNVTPVYMFGSETYTPEMRVVPQHQGTVRYSEGHVSPKFTPDNADARVNAREATPTRESTGIVSPYFSEKAPPSPSSSGRTSDLFRPRSPTTE